jgi:hypothetical protein
VAHLILFTDVNFRGAHKHIFDKTGALSLVGTDPHGNSICVANCEFPDGVSSIVILSGNWQFGQRENLADPFPVVLGPGLYRFVGDYKLVNDQIRSMQPVDDAPTIPGEPLNGYATLFENANFRGDHLHVFEAQLDLDAVNDGFAGKTSSIVVELGNWAFFFDTQFDGSYPGSPVLGPGIYPWVEDVGITNDSITSLEPSSSAATISNAVDNEVILFEYGGFYGAHRHVFAPEPNLNADDDHFFNDNVASLVVLAGTWSFYSDANFYASYDVQVTPGLYPVLGALGIPEDDMSSLRPTVTTVIPGQEILGHVILFTDANFQGPHKHVLNAEDNLNADGDSDFNDCVSSIVVLQGSWKFYRNSGFNDDYPVVLGPGLYPWVEDVSIRDNDMSSLQVVDERPTVAGDPVAGHIVLFEHALFHGAHKHIFRTEDLGADADFDKITSSFVVLSGTWNLGIVSGAYGWTGIGEGLYRWIEDVKAQTGEPLPNDALTALELTNGPVRVLGEPRVGSVILFDNEYLRGAHKHVFNREPNLNADDDSAFNDATSSIVVLEHEWFAYRDAGYQRSYDVTVGEGVFKQVETAHIAKDDMSSLQVAGERWRFSGTATIEIASGDHPGPYVAAVSMTFVFFPDTRLLVVENGFAPITTDLGTVKYGGSKDGSFAADGQITIPEFTINADSLSDTFILSTGPSTSPQGHFNRTGSPVAADGKVKLVGTGHLSGFGGLVDDDFAVVLDGTFLRQMI